MTVNHGGKLKPDYFRSYLSLLMLSRDWNLEQAENYMVNIFFKGNRDRYGSETYDNFSKAAASFKRKEKG